MKKTLVALAVLGAVGISNQAIAGLATATIDWSTFKVSLFDINPLDSISPSVSFTNKNSSVAAWANTPAMDFKFSLDWLTPIGANVGLADATANSVLIEAEANSFVSNAWSVRVGDFTLSPKTVMTIQAVANVSVTAPGAQAYASMSSQGPGANGAGYQNSLSELFITSPGSSTSLLGISFVNLTDANMSGKLRAYTYVQAIPEPETYALMLAGLGLVGWMARRRRG